MRAADFPILARYTGKSLIVTDGTTLLGADDKAGVAEIMTAVEHLSLIHISPASWRWARYRRFWTTTCPR